MKVINLVFAFVVSLVLCIQTVAADLPKPLVEVEWLVNNLDKVSILDIRAEEKSFLMNPIYIKDKKTNKEQLVRVGGHIPGAAMVLYKNVRGERSINNKKVKYMIPEKAAFEVLMQKAGINQDDLIVIATNAESDFDLTMATRMYWQLKYFGYDEVSLLNGGTAQWILSGHKVTTEPSKVSIGNWKVTKERKELIASSDEVAQAINNENVQLLDIRPLGQYLGAYKSSKVAEKGHIPTAKIYSLDLISTRKMPVTFSTNEELQQIATALGAQTDVASIAYCNSGHMASGGWFVLRELLGNPNVKLYDGSMHQWTAEKRPTVKMKIE